MVPGKIIAIDGQTATVDYGTEKRTGTIVEGEYQVGDYVLIQGQIIIDKVPKDEAEQALKTYQQAVEQS
jgi:hydrogenase maturation factor